MVSAALTAMKSGKAPEPSGLVLELFKAGGSNVGEEKKHLQMQLFIMNIPRDWNYSHVINNYKGKGDVVEKEYYRGLTLLYQIVKVIETALVPVIRDQIDIKSV